MGSGALDSTQWLSVKEETIFLHDGLMRVTDLAELPSELGVSEHGDTEQEVNFTLYVFKPRPESQCWQMTAVGQAGVLGVASSYYKPGLPPPADSRVLRCKHASV